MAMSSSKRQAPSSLWSSVRGLYDESDIRPKVPIPQDWTEVTEPSWDEKVRRYLKLNTTPIDRILLHFFGRTSSSRDKKKTSISELANSAMKPGQEMIIKGLPTQNQQQQQSQQQQRTQRQREKSNNHNIKTPSDVDFMDNTFTCKVGEYPREVRNQDLRE